MGTPSSALAIQPPPNPVDQYAKLVSLKSMMQQQQLQQAQLQGEQQRQSIAGQLAPSQVQSAQSQAQLSDTQAKQAALTLASQQGIRQAMLDATTPATAPAQGGAAPAAAGAPAMTGAGSWDRFMSNLRDPKYGVLPTDVASLETTVAGMREKIASAGSAELKQAQDAHNQLAQIGNGILTAPPDQQPALYSQALASIQANPNLAQYAANLPPQYPGADSLKTTLAGMETLNDFVNVTKQNNEAPGQVANSRKAQQQADIVQQLSTPEALAAPGAQAAITAKIQDPTTNPADIPRLRALLPKAAVAQQQAMNLKTRELQAQQIIQQGDPAAAGQLLANRSLTLDELRLRNATPDFMAKAVFAAQKIDPSFKAAESAAQGRIAGSTANQQFFGNTDSLLVPKGTLDQLQAAGTDLPAGQIPIFNSVEQLASAATGNTPTSRYAAAVLGVADDYAKVMAGSQGSDTSRKQVLDILKAAQSPQQLAASIDQVRQQVMSQRRGRIGSNPYLKDMYPEPQAAGQSAFTPPAGSRPVTQGGKIIGYTTDGVHMTPAGGQ